MITWQALLKQLGSDLASEDVGSSLGRTARGFIRTVRRAHQSETAGQQRPPEFDDEPEQPETIETEGEKVP